MKYLLILTAAVTLTACMGNTTIPISTPYAAGVVKVDKNGTPNLSTLALQIR